MAGLDLHLSIISEPGERWVRAYGSSHHSVSSLGRVYSHRRNRIMAVEVDKRQNSRVLIRIGRRSRWLLGRLVLASFTGTNPPTMEAVHVNGDIRCNALSNLRWAPDSKHDAAWSERHRIIGTVLSRVGSVRATARVLGMRTETIARHARQLDR